MAANPLEWELQQLEPGTEILVSDANKRPVARGVLRDDRKSLSGANGEHFSFETWQDAWTMTILRQRKSNPRGQEKF